MSLTVRVSIALCTAAVGTVSAQTYDASLFETMEYRLVGPFRGGRSTAVTGVADEPFTFYMGTTGGGVWQTTDAGQTWQNISDGFVGVGSIGAVDVADTDPNVIYVGTGSAGIRGNVSTGRGLYRSTDGGDTWKSIGLENAGLVGKIEVHPHDPDIVFVAALGRPFGKSAERGVFRSLDGGSTWTHVLALNDSVGAVDLALNPHNPREIYAGMWRVERKPWTLIDASEDGGVYKTTDGGNSWTKLAGGLPQGLTGRIGLAISPANPQRVWAQVNARDPEGGVYRSDDAGSTWTRVNRDRKLRQRHWYYSHLTADPQDENTVYAMNTALYRSIDGGKQFEPISVPHGDVHDLWINPDNTSVMIVANDGGAQVSLNGGETWSTYLNQPTAEMYRVTVDNQFPYRLYGGQQDNSTITVPSWSVGSLTPHQNWFSVGGCESGHVAVHPRDPNVVYSGCYIGEVTRYDHRTSDLRNVMVFPALVDGIAPKDLPYRFQWNAPIAFSPHDPDVLYTTSNHVHRTHDGGQTWETISPDLTTDDSTKQDFPGGPLQHDHTSVEVYTTIFAFAESPHSAGTFWAGSDDGLVHLSRDNGATWIDITPSDLPTDATVNAIEVSPHQPGRAFLAAHRYRIDDFAPYVFGTDDYGNSWRRLTDGRNGIPADSPVRVVREDPDRHGLLYAGTEFGMFISFDDGDAWQPFQLNLPVTPVTDLKIHDQDLVVATQGRSYWILDDLTPLHQIEQAAAGDQYLYKPRDTYRVRRSRSRSNIGPQAPPAGAVIRYRLSDATDDSVTVEVLDATQRVIRTFSSTSEDSTTKAPADSGINRLVWDLQYEGLELPEGAMAYLGYAGGQMAVPGTYQVRVTRDAWTQTQPSRVLPDPRLPNVSDQDLRAQFELSTQIRRTLGQVYEAIKTIRGVRDQTKNVSKRARDAGYASEIPVHADSIEKKLTRVEDSLINTNSESRQDPINFPPQLDNQLGYLYGKVVRSYGRPTRASYERYDELRAKTERFTVLLQTILDEDVATFNSFLREQGVPALITVRADRPIS